MRIQICDGERNIRILLPTCLIFSRLTAWIGSAAINKYVPQRSLSGEQIDKIFAEFRRIKTKHGRWDLVDVESADGEKVKVIL